VTVCEYSFGWGQSSSSAPRPLPATVFRPLKVAPRSPLWNLSFPTLNHRPRQKSKPHKKQKTKQHARRPKDTNIVDDHGENGPAPWTFPQIGEVSVCCAPKDGEKKQILCPSMMDRSGGPTTLIRPAKGTMKVGGTITRFGESVPRQPAENGEASRRHDIFWAKNVPDRQGRQC